MYKATHPQQVERKSPLSCNEHTRHAIKKPLNLIRNIPTPPRAAIAQVLLMPLGTMSGADGIVIGGAGNLTGQLLERATLGLGDEQSGEDTAEHEEGEDLHDVVEPGRVVGARGSTAGAERAEDDLGDDGADFTRGGGKAVRGAAVARWEAFAGDDERCCVGTCEDC